MVVISGVIKPCALSYTRALRFLMTRSCANLDSLGNLDFGPKSGFKNKFRVGFGLHIEARLQVWDELAYSWLFDLPLKFAYNRKSKRKTSKSNLFF